MRNYFVLNNVDSRDFGVYISGQGTFKAPSRVYNMVTIPGRNGDLVGYEKRFENIAVTYPAFIYSNFSKNIESLRSFLLSLRGYHKLFDTYHPDEYRMALYQGPFDPEVTKKNDAGSFEITFNCKPQRYLVSGEDRIELSANASIYNPTLFDAQPLFRVYGAGEFGVNGDTITITQADVYTDIDCEMMDAFKGSISKNAYVQLSSNDFPVLHSGENTITLGAGVSKIEVIPRWWTV